MATPINNLLEDGHYHFHFVADYYPFGKILRKFVSNQAMDGDERYQSTYHERDTETGFDFRGARYYDSDVARFLSVDPLAADYMSISPYVYVANNPVMYIDPDGQKFINFDSNGNYIGTSKDNRWHNFWHGSKGRILNVRGDVRQKFKFADPKNDVESIQSGRISKLIVVSSTQVKKMAINAGAFDEENRGLNSIKFINKEGKGGGRFDFSFGQIPSEFKIPKPVKDGSGNWVAPNIFLIDGVAHNHMNFGNFMFGVGGATLGFNIIALKLGAHKNSKYPEDSNGNRYPSDIPNLNGYPPQWDSADDQFSIKEGYHYARGGGMISRWFGGRRWDKQQKSKIGTVTVGRPISM